MTLSPGTRLGSYELLALVGGHTPGEVYRAHDAGRGQVVALRVLPSDTFDTPEARERSGVELQSLVSLQHPHIGAVYAFEQVQGYDVIATEYVEGAPLSRVLDDGPLSEPDAVRLVLQLLDALAAIHERRIVHRALRPSNLCVTSDGPLKVLDVALPIWTRAPGADTSGVDAAWAGAGMGYQAPEQVRGEPVDARSDLYAVGAVLYEMVTGQCPFASDRADELARAICDQAPLSLRTFDVALSPELDGSVLRCLAKRPSDRYQTAKELSQDLRPIDVGSRRTLPARAASRSAAAPDSSGPDPEWFQGTARFPIVRQLGAGGMGVVYEADDLERGVPVALKTLLRVDARGLLRFKQEFRALAEIVHPNLVPLYELISDGERWFFTMELVGDASDFLTHVRGGLPTAPSPSLPQRRERAASAVASSRDETLVDGDSETRTLLTADPDDVMNGRLLPERPVGTPGTERSEPRSGPRARLRYRQELDYERLRRAFAQLTEGVLALHASGKLHRDLKPANALVRSDGRVVLLDFGLVAELSQRPVSPTLPADVVVSGSAYRSSDSHIIGTVAYMAPEQAVGDPLTFATDWYAVGVMLFQALTGRLPFRGSVGHVLRCKLEQRPPLTSDLVEGVPPDLDEACRELLRRRPGERPTGEALLRCFRGGEIAAATESPQEPTRVPFIGRQRHLTVLFGAVHRMLKGETVLYHVHGRSGAGKSALVGHFLDQIAVEHDALILTGRCYEQESVPYKALDGLVDALTRYLARLSGDDVRAVLPPHVAALARVFPVLNQVPMVRNATRAEESLPDLQELRRRAFGALRGLLGAIGRLRPLVLFIDDLQWGDVDSAAMLSEVLRPPDAPRVLLLNCYRSEYRDVSACLQALHGLATGDAQTPDELVVDVLTHDETRQLARALLPAERADQADRIVRESKGSAYLVYELARHVRTGARWTTSGQLDLDDVLWQRVLSLTDDAKQLLAVIAVAGQIHHLDEHRNTELGPHLVGRLADGRHQADRRDQPLVRHVRQLGERRHIATTEPQFRFDQIDREQRRDESLRQFDAKQADRPAPDDVGVIESGQVGVEVDHLLVYAGPRRCLGRGAARSLIEVLGAIERQRLHRLVRRYFVVVSCAIRTPRAVEMPSQGFRWSVARRLQRFGQPSVVSPRDPRVEVRDDALSHPVMIGLDVVVEAGTGAPHEMLGAERGHDLGRQRVELPGSLRLSQSHRGRRSSPTSQGSLPYSPAGRWCRAVGCRPRNPPRDRSS